MALFITLFTHLCMHILGLMGNPVLTLIFSAVPLLTYRLYLGLLPAVWPGRISDDTLTCINAMKTRLHEEAARRPMLDMYSLSTYGLRVLEDCIFVGDWLTSNNLRAARRDRTDDINATERLEYADELSAPWHIALQATHMIMRTHYGQAVEDPGSLAAHKGLLN
ncbi:hypothetical protein B0H13DRAFT_2329013 [Mycena leptocephala]|nr:hypothetical protein B0H13DRAFT_2329013 [Mycena leptocephala]